MLIIFVANIWVSINPEQMSMLGILHLSNIETNARYGNSCVLYFGLVNHIFFVGDGRLIGNLTLSRIEIGGQEICLPEVCLPLTAPESRGPTLRRRRPLQIKVMSTNSSSICLAP